MNIVGHLIPGFFLVWWTPKKVELFVAGGLLSSIVMNSPIWGGFGSMNMLYLYGRSLSMKIWTAFLILVIFINGFNSITISQNLCSLGYQHGIPSASMIFWRLVGRSLGTGSDMMASKTGKRG